MTEQIAIGKTKYPKLVKKGMQATNGMPGNL
jgi:hypothetical protein